MPKSPVLSNCKNSKKTTDGKRGTCPLTELLSRLGDKWSVLIIVALAEAPDNKYRFSELKKKVEGISQRMLTATLRNLERDGILTRNLFPEIPPRVEYELTPLGLGILEPMQHFVDWIEGNWSHIHASREKFDNGLRAFPKKTPKVKSALHASLNSSAKTSGSGLPGSSAGASSLASAKLPTSSATSSASNLKPGLIAGTQPVHEPAIILPHKR